MQKTHLATGPIMLKISNSMASVTVPSSSPTYSEAPAPGVGAGAVAAGVDCAGVTGAADDWVALEAGLEGGEVGVATAADILGGFFVLFGVWVGSST